jgi:hypothetical protein
MNLDFEVISEKTLSKIVDLDSLRAVIRVILKMCKQLSQGVYYGNQMLYVV